VTLRLSWAEVADILKQHIHLPGVQLGEPRIFSQVMYGGSEEEVEGASLEFPVLLEVPAQAAVEIPKHLLFPAAPPELEPPAIDPDTPF
jgi:hypothetical protein